MGRDARLTGEIIRKDIQRVIFAFFLESPQVLKPVLSRDLRWNKNERNSVCDAA